MEQTGFGGTSCSWQTLAFGAATRQHQVCIAGRVKAEDWHNASGACCGSGSVPPWVVVQAEVPLVPQQQRASRGGLCGAGARVRGCLSGLCLQVAAEGADAGFKPGLNNNLPASGLVETMMIACQQHVR